MRQKIADWAARNGFVFTGTAHKKTTDGADISIEVKRSSIVMIWVYPGGRKPRIRTSLFKDIPVDTASGEISPLGFG